MTGLFVKNMTEGISGTVHVDLAERSYDILIGVGLLGRLGSVLRDHGLADRRFFIVSDSNVSRLYGDALARHLSTDLDVTPIEIPEGEAQKNLSTVEGILTRLLEGGADRSAVVLALGGGVTGDVAGFAASTYMRGVSCVQCPTTLLAQVDSSVGGKTGVNHPRGKNLIGTFHQPRLVCIDLETLKTLPPRDYRCGLYEVVKYAFIRDRDFFEDLSKDLSGLLERRPDTMLRVVERCCRIKAEVTSRDETEADLRRILNFGHTFGHALEAATGYRLLTHGEAIGFGMKAALVLSRDLGKLPAQDCIRALALIDRLGSLPSIGGLPFHRIFEGMMLDKKRLRGQLRLVILNGIGAAEVVSDPGRDILERAWREGIGPSSKS